MTIKKKTASSYLSSPSFSPFLPFSISTTVEADAGTLIDATCATIITWLLACIDRYFLTIFDLTSCEGSPAASWWRNTDLIPDSIIIRSELTSRTSKDPFVIVGWNLLRHPELVMSLCECFPNVQLVPIFVFKMPSTSEFILLWELKKAYLVKLPDNWSLFSSNANIGIWTPQ